MVRQRHNERQREFKRREDFVIQAQTRLWKEREREKERQRGTDEDMERERE